MNSPNTPASDSMTTIPSVPAAFRKRGFLPEQDPLTAFPAGTSLTMLDQLGRDLPAMLEKPDFRRTMENQPLPDVSKALIDEYGLPLLRLYYLRTGFLASAYINQVGQPKANRLPRSLAGPLCWVCRKLFRKSILSYDGYALYNWRRLDIDGPVALGNLDTIQNFVTLYDEHWFILVHIEIEAIAAQILDSIAALCEQLPELDVELLNQSLWKIASAVQEQRSVLERIPQRMDHRLYYKTFRPYIRFFENVTYEGQQCEPMHFRGETGAQSTIMPLLVEFMKIPHQHTVLTDHLADMRNYMPAEHRQLLESMVHFPNSRLVADKDAFNTVLEAMAAFRHVHYGWAEQYINQHTDDPRGTGGTPYMEWLKQLIDETLDYRIA